MSTSMDADTVIVSRVPNASAVKNRLMVNLILASNAAPLTWTKWPRMEAGARPPAIQCPWAIRAACPIHSSAPVAESFVVRNRRQRSGFGKNIGTCCR